MFIIWGTRHLEKNVGVFYETLSAIMAVNSAKMRLLVR